MTTNHRPQLESKRGRDISIKNTIKHARAQPGQTKLKIRLDIVGAQIGEKRGRQALEDLQVHQKKPKFLDLKSTETGVARYTSSIDPVTANSEDDASSTREGTRSLRSDDEDPSNHSSEYESDLESEEAAETLLLELEKTRAENKARQESIPEKPKNVGSKRGWRSKTLFSRGVENTEKFTTNIMKSKAHQKFLSDYIR